MIVFSYKTNLEKRLSSETEEIKLIKNYLSEILLILIGIFIVFLAIFVNSWIFSNIENVVKTNIIEQSKLMLQIAVNTIEKIYEKYVNGEITEKIAQDMAKEYIGNTFYGPENLDYFWILSTDGVLIAHPYMKQYIGKHYSEVEDETYKRAIQDILNSANSGKNYTEYVFYRYDINETEEKISAIHIFKPWRWIIGTGSYKTSILAHIKNIRQVFRDVFALLLLVIYATYSAFVFQYIKSNIEKKEMLRKISLERDRLRTLIESIPQPVVFFDRSGNLVLYNSNYEELLKVASESLEQILTIFKDTKNIPREFALKTPSGMKWFSLELKEILDEKNTFDGILMVLTDITEQKLQILFWQDRAYQDPLTGIANRNLLEELSENFLDLGEKFSVIMIDLDNFKQLNDKYGHVFGDKILKNFANILKNSIRKDAFLIRYGGDEFTVIISKHGNDLAETIIKRIQSKLEKPFEIDGRKIKLTFCSGIANSPEDGKNIKELINLADKRLYENKKEKAKYLE